MPKINIIFLIAIIYKITGQLNSIQIINYKKQGINSIFSIKGKQTYELIFDSLENIPDNLQLKFESLNNIQLSFSSSSLIQTSLNDYHLRGKKLKFDLKRSHLFKEKNYLYVSCEKSIYCKFNLEIYEKRIETKSEEFTKMNFNLFSIFPEENENDIILRGSTSDKNIELYTLESIFESAIQIPKDRIKTYQIPEGASGKYRVTSGKSVKVDNLGLITPVNTTWYCYYYGVVACSTWEQPGKPADIIKIEYTLGTSVVTATIDDKQYTITVNVKDYGDEYVDNKLNDYIKKNVTIQKTQLDKLNAITAYPAKFPYNSSVSSYKGMVIFEGGDCWGSTGLINRLCEKVGIKSHSRYAANDYGSGSGHLNVAALIDGKIYIADAGYGYERPNRPYEVKELNIGYSYKGNSKNGIYIYQYDGYETNIQIPSVIDNKTVYSLQEPVFYNGYNDGKDIIKITLPETIEMLADKALQKIPNITSITIPKNVKTIGSDMFTECYKLSSIIVDPSNEFFSSKNGILYDKNKTKIKYFPPGKKGNYTCLPTIQKIEYYSFYSVNQMIKVVIPKNVIEIGQFAFARSSIKEIYFEGEPPIFQQNCLQNLNVSIYYPQNNSNWTNYYMGNCGAKEIRYFEWIPSIVYDDDEDDDNDNENNNDNNSNNYLYYYIGFGIIGLILIIGIIIIIICCIKRNSKKKQDKEILNANFDNEGLVA